MWGGEVGNELRRVDWMVCKRERRGGGRVFGGGWMALDVAVVVMVIEGGGVELGGF